MLGSLGSGWLRAMSLCHLQVSHKGVKKTNALTGPSLCLRRGQEPQVILLLCSAFTLHILLLICGLITLQLRSLEGALPAVRDGTLREGVSMVWAETSLALEEGKAVFFKSELDIKRVSLERCARQILSG